MHATALRGKASRWLGTMAWLAGCGSAAAPAAQASDAAVAVDAAAPDAADTAIASDTATQPVVNLHLRTGFLAIAHRGGGKLAPEHTLAAYQNALQLGADVIECDVHSTADNALVCIHDATVDRTTNGTGKVRDMTLAQLRALDAGYRFSADGGMSFPFRDQGLQVPTLQEFLAVSATAGLSIEIKQADPPLAAPVVEAIRAAGAVDRTVLVSFLDATLAEVRALGPELTTGLALGEMLAFAGLDDTTEASYLPPGKVLQASYTQFDPAQTLARAHRLGMKVQFWTVNQPDDMAMLLGLGADAIFTDDPASLLALLAKQ